MKVLPGLYFFFHKAAEAMLMYMYVWRPMTNSTSQNKLIIVILPTLLTKCTQIL